MACVKALGNTTNFTPVSTVHQIVPPKTCQQGPLACVVFFNFVWSGRSLHRNNLRTEAASPRSVESLERTY